jgi:hypothetical protein
VSPVKYELGLYIPDDDILHNVQEDNIKNGNGIWPWTRSLDKVDRHARRKVGSK